MPDGNAPLPTPPKRRLTIFYVVLAAATAIVAAVVITAGEDRTPQPAIAGGYDVTGAAAKCLGPQFDVQQSGQYVNLTNAKETVGGKLTFKDGKLTGDVDCVEGGGQAIDAKVADGVVAGTLGATPVKAELKRDPPDPGAQKPRAPASIAGIYKVSPRSGCLGGKFELDKTGSGAYELTGKGISGELKYADGIVTGTVTCKSGNEWNATAQAVDRNLNNLILAPKDAPTPDVPGATPAGGEKVTATKQRESFGAQVGIFLLAVAVVMLFARLLGEAAVRIRQPRVMGEVVAGLLLGPTLFGWLLPDLQSTIFASDILPTIGLVANLGLIFYVFLVGLELDPSQLKGRAGQAAAISNASVALPMMLGIAVALPLYELVGPDKKFVAFAIYMGVAMSITAFPVLARILVERRMLKRPVGALAMTCAAIDDITAWFLIALATAIATAGTGMDVVRTIALAIAFCLGMVLLIRPVIARVSTAYDEAGKVPGAWVVVIFAGVLLSSFLTEQIGIAVIFGAFMMGAIMPRNAGLTEDVTHRVEDFVVVLLLPLFFAYTGLRMNVGLLDRPELWLITLLLIAIAIVGKWIGAMAAARMTGFDWRASNVIGALMNTRGLTELIVLNLALDAGVISQALFAMLVIMALVTTFMAGPALNLLDPKNSYGESLDTEMETARATSRAELPALVPPERAILVAPQSDAALAPLRALAEPLARSEPPRELILARLVEPPRAADAGVRAGLQTEQRLLETSEHELRMARLELADEGIASRAVAFVSAQPGHHLVQLAESEEVDLVLIEGSRPLLGGGVPRGDVGYVLEHAPTDVAVLVAREGADITELGRPVVVPFGGQEHDWAALELGAWMASSTGAELRLLGAAGQTEDQTKVKRVLDDASLLVRQFAAVEPEPVIADSGGLLEAASDAGLLVVGLSQRWRREGLGQVRSDLANAGVAPILFVRRGERPGALAPRSDVTHFAWSSAGIGGGGGLTPAGQS
jgi:Kef-type K+ transport system membrane component KefB